MTTLETLELQKEIEKAIKTKGDRYFYLDAGFVRLTTKLGFKGLTNTNDGTLIVSVNGGKELVRKNIYNGEMFIVRQADIIDKVALRFAQIKMFGAYSESEN